MLNPVKQTDYLPEPVLLNCLKHHAGYISDFIRNYELPELKENKKSSWEQGSKHGSESPQKKGYNNVKQPKEGEDQKNFPELRETLTFIGKSQMDLYTGKLSPLQIAEEISEYLKSNNLLNKAAYLKWINLAASAYREARLSDSSFWVFLPGKITDRHVHIHPGRHSPFTMRVRSETLKTAIAVLCYCSRFGKDPSDLAMINLIRSELLDLSPVKELNPGRGLARMIGVLAEMPPSGENLART